MTMRRLAAAFLVLAAALACSDATDVELVEIEGTGVIGGRAFLDFDGNGEFGPGDQPLVGVEVELVTSGVMEVLLTATTDAAGFYALFGIPVGSYLVALGDDIVSDSLEVVGGDDPVTVAFGDTTEVDLGVSYPTLTIEELLAAPAGRRVFTSGIALNQRLNFDPTGRVHFRGASAYLRALNVERSGVSVGDSVRVLGRIVSDNGRPALDVVTPAVLVPAAALPIPVETTPGTAAIANGGALDAALVRIRNVEIADTSTNVEGHFRFWAYAGPDSVEVVVRDFLGLNTALIRPDTIVRISQATGLLTPVQDGVGAVRWQMLPRAATDLTLETRLADVGVTIAVDTAQASLGDTVEVTIVATNAGPLAATGARIGTAAATALTRLSTTQTVGTYDTGTGTWSLGDMAVGASDTLRISYEVTSGTPATLAVSAQSLGLVFEVDPNGGNNAAGTTLVIS